MHIVSVFTPDWTWRHRPRFLRLRNEALFQPQRWIAFPVPDDHRERLEAIETTRLRERKPPSLGRRRAARAANECYYDANGVFMDQNHQDVRWTAQCLGGSRLGGATTGVFDELLYRLYARNLDVFGAKAASDLYTFDITPRCRALGDHYTGSCDTYYEYRIERTDECDQVISGTTRLRLFAILNEVQPPFHDLAHTFFSPAISVATVLSPKYELDNAIHCVAQLSGSFDIAKFKQEESHESDWQTLDALMLAVARTCLYNLSSDASWCNLRPSPLTQLTVFVIGVDESKVTQGALVDPALLGEQWLAWRTHFLHFLGRLCLSAFRYTKAADDVDSTAAPYLRCEQEFAALKLRDFVERYLPKRSQFSITSDTFNIVTPGRKVIVRSLNREHVEETKRRDERSAWSQKRDTICKPKDTSDYNEFYDYNGLGRGTLDSVAWNTLLCSLVTSQEALLSHFHDAVLEDEDVARVRKELKEFDDFYDVALFDLPGSAPYQASFNELKKALNLDSQYAMLHRKLELAVGKIHAGNLRWAIVAILAVTIIDIIRDTKNKWLVAAPFSAASIYILLRPMQWQVGLFCKQVITWIMNFPALVLEPLEEAVDTEKRKATNAGRPRRLDNIKGGGGKAGMSNVWRAFREEAVTTKAPLQMRLLVWMSVVLRIVRELSVSAWIVFLLGCTGAVILAAATFARHWLQTRS
jgi:hypothetical protein